MAWPFEKQPLGGTMLEPTNNKNAISIPIALQLVGIIGGVWALLVVGAATLAYVPQHPDFSPFATFLSDIGDTAGWPKIFFNSGTLIAAPIRYLVLVLLVLRLIQLGAGKPFAVVALIVAFASTFGTILMTAVPFSVSPSIHKLGIPLYFVGVVILQTMIGTREWSLREIPKILPMLSFLMVVVYFVFASLVILHEKGAVSRTTPVIWEWLAFFSSLVWVFAQSIMLGRISNAR
jgi:hypothetical protein